MGKQRKSSLRKSKLFSEFSEVSQFMYVFQAKWRIF